MKAAIYLRVSSKDGRQDEANQEPECSRLCAGRGWEAVVFRERESAVKERPQWRAVLEAARLGQVGAVVFWALDRTGRNRVQVAHDLGELFRWKVHVASVKDSWLDIGAGAGPLRDLLVQVMAWTAEGERDRLRERTRAGLDRARAQGKVLGRRPALEGAKLGLFRIMVGKGWSVAELMAEFRLPRSTVRTWIARVAKNVGPGATS